MPPNHHFLSKLVLTSFACVSITAFAAPPFVQGQIAVYAPPHEIMEYKVEKFLPNAGISLISVESGKEWGQMQKLRQKGLNAGLNYLAQASLKPNDQYYPYQWHFPAVQAEQAWDITTGLNSITTQPVKVAVLDTGIVTAPPGGDGVSQCPNGYDIVNNDNDPTDGSSLSHGTHVAGTISQITSFNNQTPATGTAGLAPGACVLVVKVLDDTGSGSFADIADGIYYAINQGADVINMSLGVNARFGLTNDAIMDPALEAAYDAGVTVVAAAGNDGNRKNVSYPAIYHTVIAVGATDYRNQLTRYSNQGTGLDIVAPGGDTSRDDNNDNNSDGVLQETVYQGNFGHYWLQGTSMASPHVAAIAALLVSSGLEGPDEVFSRITSTTIDLGETGLDSKYGHGLVQAYDALTNNGGTPEGPPEVASNPFPANEAINIDTNTTLSWTAGARADSHSVYLGVETLDLVSSEQTTTSYTTSGLLADTVYQWQVVEQNAYGPTYGPIWTFRTTVAQCTDLDNDGYCVSQGDCDDTNPDVYPGHPDRGKNWGRDGIDNDCDGVADR